MLKSVIVIASFVILNVSGRPQTDRELAVATRLQEQVYYNLDEVEASMQAFFAIISLCRF